MIKKIDYYSFILLFRIEQKKNWNNLKDNKDILAYDNPKIEEIFPRESEKERICEKIESLIFWTYYLLWLKQRDYTLDTE